MRDALQLTNLGAFKFTGNIDFCKSAQTDFPITWTTQFDVLQTSRQIGQTIEANGVFTTNKQLDAVAIKGYRVSRTQRTGYWDLVAPAAGSALAAGSAGSPTALGTNVNFVSDIVSGDSGKQWTLRTSFTPNIKLFSSVQSLLNTDVSTSQPLAMITLPDDRNLVIAYTITMLIRMYADQRQNFAGQRRRRLLYRDVAVQNIETAASVQDAELTTKPVTIRVPENIQVSSDGSVTVLSTSSSPTLSAGAIAGIAVVGAVVAAALVALGVLLARRSKRNAEAKADAEAAAASADKMLAQAKLSKTTTSRVVA
ncbi:hypothetical protein DFJ74DRAFT_5497 [Hyaloraphidium curvatum]|nr:hypothetical protein DFJ74DRAFT_5497 [Hyaloraphidium curvatum]